MGKLRYNYDFFREWKKREGRSFKEIRDAVENSSNNNIHDWMGDGPAQEKMRAKGVEEHPVPINVESIIKLCNAFDIPLESFFWEDDHAAKLHVPIRIQNVRQECREEEQHPDGTSTKISLLELELKLVKERLADKDETIAGLRIAIDSLKTENSRLYQQYIAEKNSGLRRDHLDYPPMIAAEDFQR